MLFKKSLSKWLNALSALTIPSLLLSSILLTPTGAMDIVDEPSYSINIMWVNSCLPSLEKGEFVLPEDKLKTINQWASGNPDAKINLWYDSTFILESAFENTQTFLSLTEWGQQVVLKDIRSLKDVMDNPDVFSDTLPIYFRVDLLRVIAADNEIQKRDEKYFVYSDLNIDPLPVQELFDSDTLKALNLFGLVLPQNKGFDLSFRFENGFFIMDSSNSSMVRATRLGLIEINIERGKKALQEGSWKIESFDSPYGSPFKRLEQIVFSSYKDVLNCFYFFNGKVEFTNDQNQIVALNFDNIKAVDVLNLDTPGFKYPATITYYTDVYDRVKGEYYFGEKTTERSCFHTLSMGDLLKKNINKPQSHFYSRPL